MVDLATLVGGALLTLVGLVVLVVLVLLVLWGLRQYRRSRAYTRTGVSHLDLYFDEHFGTVVRNFDLVTTSRFDLWARDIGARLEVLGRDIEMIGSARKGLDTRMDKLERRVGDLE